MSRLVQIAIGLVFLLSGLLKLGDPARFLDDLQAFPFVPYSLAFATVLILPWAEVLSAVALIIGRLRSGALMMLGLMTAVFIAFILLAHAMGIDADCGCFGDWLVFPNPFLHVAFNAVLLGLIGGQLVRESVRGQ
ncbi:MAG: hypothetical protein JJU20_13860 [Opitutales bacterium]|nr:hypothetical protein [Opitutales bacterium]